MASYCGREQAEQTKVAIKGKLEYWRMKWCICWSAVHRLISINVLHCLFKTLDIPGSTVVQWQPRVPVLLKHYTHTLFECQSESCTFDLQPSTYLTILFFPCFTVSSSTYCHQKPPELMWLWLCTKDGSFCSFKMSGWKEQSGGVPCCLPRWLQMRNISRCCFQNDWWWETVCLCL